MPCTSAILARCGGTRRSTHQLTTSPPQQTGFVNDWLSGQDQSAAGIVIPVSHNEQWVAVGYRMLVLGPASQWKGGRLNHDRWLVCTQLCRVFVLELLVSALKDIGSDVRRVPTSEPVEVSVDCMLVVSLLHERRVQPCCSLDESSRTRACCVEAVELTCDDAILASRRQFGGRVRKLVDLESLLLECNALVKQRRSPP